MRLRPRAFLWRILGSQAMLLVALATTACGPSAPAAMVPATPTASASPATKAALTVSASASLTDVLNAINSAYVAQNLAVTITPNFASSGTLQTQIENGAPVDVFISAGATQMDNLQRQNLLLNETRRDLLNNRVVMVVPFESALRLTSLGDLVLDKVKKIAIGDPKSVPAGMYASQAFDELGITAQLQPKEVLAADVRQVLTYVESGNVDAGVVYWTDAITSPKVKVVAVGPEDINAKIVYPVAVMKASKNRDLAKSYIDFLLGAQAKALFEKYGFTLVVK